MEAKIAHCAMLAEVLLKLKNQAKDKKAIEKLLVSNEALNADIAKLRDGIDAFMSAAGEAVTKINDGEL